MAHAQIDIRWHQRLQNYELALARLVEAVELADAIANQVVVRYHALFQALQVRFQMLRDAG